MGVDVAMSAICLGVVVGLIELHCFSKWTIVGGGNFVGRVRKGSSEVLLAAVLSG